METTRNGADHVYTREEILRLRAEHKTATLPEHLYCPDYLTSHGKFSPDKYVECLWKDERTQKTVLRVLRTDLPEILQNGSTLTPQRKNFKTGCKEESFAFPSSTRNFKQEKRGTTTTNTWSKDNFSKGASTTNGYRFTTGYAQRNNNSGRRDSDRVEPMPEWMDDGPDSNTEVMHLGGFNDQEKRLEQSFQKLGLPDAITRQQQQTEEEKLVLPVSDLEFAAQFGILDVSEIESKIFKDGIEEPKSSRLSRFFGSEKPKEGRETPKSPPKTESPVLPAVARLLSAGSKTIGPLSDPPSNNAVMDFIKQTQTNTQAAHTSTVPVEHVSAISQQHQMYHQPIHRHSVDLNNDHSITQKQKKNIDLVPTSVMIQRSTKDDVTNEGRAPKFSNPNTPSPIIHHTENEMIASQHSQHSNHPQWQSDNLQNFNDSNLSNPNGGLASMNCIPALARLGTHIFPIPNPIAFTTDNKIISEAYRNGDYKTISGLQGRMNVQMQVFAALQHFRHDPSFVIVTANDPQFDRLLDSFVDQQRQFESSLSDRFDEDLIECAHPPEPNNLSPTIASSLDQMMNNPSLNIANNDSNGHSGNLSILNRLPATARPLTVEELERQILGNC